jgi:hypothetical protein
MNERLQELKRRAVAEADTSHIDFDNMGHTEIQMLVDIATEKKFAELIVRECAWFMEINTKVNDDGAVVDAPDAQQMLEHFGVEE